MTYDAVILLYLGSVGSIVILNAVQWGISRDSIYGLFTFQTFLSLTNAVMFGLELTNLERDVIYWVAVGLMHVSYLELVDRLFNLPQRYPRLHRWFRAAQLLVVVSTVFDLGVFLTQSDRNNNPLLWLVTILFGSFFVITCVAGMWVAAQHRDLVGRFFLLGSFFVFLDETRAVVTFSGLVWNQTPPPPLESFGWLLRIMGAIYILELLSFSLCLLFRQRQLAVAQAVEQTRVKEQLVHERDQRQRESLEAELAVQRLEQEKTEVQLRALQAQVNPHFLFNSLNSLSSLIDDDPQRAGQFVDELSQVYRYLLRANDQPLTTLEDELAFINSYYHLLKTRHGKGLDLSVRVQEADKNGLLPPLTLQLLVENAVKHNVVLPNRPVLVEILSDSPGYLTVRNTLQRKKTPVFSNGVGLSTIFTQYRQLRQPEPVVVEAEDTFAIILPLITPSVPE